MERIFLSRSELYDMVWSTPMRDILLKFNISYEKLRRTCKDLEISYPKPGHWQKLKYGKESPQPPLVAGKEEVQISFIPKRNFFSKAKKGDSTPPSLKTTVKSSKKPKLLTRDKLVKDAKIFLLSGKASDWHADGMVKSKGDILDTRVSRRKVTRALIICNCIIKELRLKGHEISIRNNNTCCIVYEQESKICLREATKAALPQKENSYRKEFKATGTFYFQLNISK